MGHGVSELNRIKGGIKKKKKDGEPHEWKRKKPAVMK